MNFEIKWDSTMEGLEISFEHEGERHRSLLPWTRIEEMRQEMVRDIWAQIPKITAGVFHEEPHSPYDPDVVMRPNSADMA